MLTKSYIEKIMTHPDLSELSSEDLAKELLTRNDMFEGSFLTPAIYKLSIELGIPPCVDGVAVRKRDDGTIEALAITRNTGPFKGTLCSIGGRILFEESLETAMRRQFMTDLGVHIEFLTPWDQPAVVHQFMRPQADGTVLPDFGVEPTRRHNITIVYMVRLLTDDFQYGSTETGGQEAAGVEWFSLKNMPPPDAFGYGQDVYFKKCLKLAEMLL